MNTKGDTSVKASDHLSALALGPITVYTLFFFIHGILITDSISLHSLQRTLFKKEPVSFFIKKSGFNGHSQLMFLLE